MRCPEVQPLLSEYVDGYLAPALRAGVREHLDGCPACRAERSALDRSLAALDAAARREPPDLWASFAARLGASLPCSEVEGLLAPLAAGDLTGSRAAEARFHVETCPTCAASATGLDRALGALERTGRAIPAVDLWPQFVSRLEAQPRRHWLSGDWINGALLRPAFGAAALALVILLAGRSAGPPIGTEPPGPVVSSMPGRIGPVATGTVAPGAGAAPKAPSEPAPAGVRIASDRGGRPDRRERLSAPRRGTNVRVAAARPPASERATRRRAERPERAMLVRSDLPPSADAPTDAPVRLISDVLAPGEERKLVAQVLPMLEMLADREAASEHPFGKESDAP